MSDKTPKKSIFTRLATGLIAGVIGFYSFVVGGWMLFALVVAISIVGALEFASMLNHKGLYPFKSVILIFSLLFVFLASMKIYTLIPLLLAIATMTAFVAVILKGRQPYTANVATTVLGFLYCGWLPAHILMIRHLYSTRLGFLNFELNNGLIIFMMYFCGVTATDAGAYYLGKKFGKHQMAPVISPNKTIEGSLGGMFTAFIVCAVIGLFTGMPFIHIICLALIISVFSQLGDLSESLLKRDACVKDSGNCLPGHGGFLDRVDGYIFTAPIVYYYAYYFMINNAIFFEIWEKIVNVI